MKKRLAFWGVYAVLGCLIFVGCHRSSKQPKATGKESDSVIRVDVDTTDTTTQPLSDENEEEGESPIKEETTNPKEYDLRRDTAEITNLRLFARKQRVIYNPKLLVGEWLRDAEHEEYFADSTGRRWDTSEDIKRSEAQFFNWSLDSNLLTIKYTLTFGGLMVRQYVVTFVDDENLVYRDAFDGNFMWEKVLDSADTSTAH